MDRARPWVRWAEIYGQTVDRLINYQNYTNTNYQARIILPVNKTFILPVAQQTISYQYQLHSQTATNTSRSAKHVQLPVHLEHSQIPVPAHPQIPIPNHPTHSPLPIQSHININSPFSCVIRCTGPLE